MFYFLVRKLKTIQQLSSYLKNIKTSFMKKIVSTPNLRQLAFCFLVVIGISSCKKDNGVTPAARPDLTFYALNSNNQILKLNAKTVETTTTTVSIIGLPVGEKIVSIDFRPATGQLYGLGSSSRLYMINYDNGNAFPLGTAAFTPTLSGTISNIDFNPTVDRVRLVTDAAQNLRLNPETGTVAATDANINGGSSPTITGIAYTNNKAGASTTVLFDIDATTKKLYRQEPPNNGILVEVGNLNVNFTGQAGFDINSDNSIALASLTVNSKSQLHTIDINTGAATYLGDFATNVIDIAIPTDAVAYAVDETNNLLIFDPTKTATIVSKPITGLNVGENVVGLDFRPANGQLYALGTTALGTARLLTINASSGAAAVVGIGFTVNTSSTSFGFDFNPTVDRIRVVTNSGQNLRLNPNDGTVAATDANLNPGTPSISGAAYTNNFPGATTTTLYVLDATKLYTQNPPNNGTLVDNGNLGITIDAANGFDIGGRSGTAFGLFTVGTTNKIYTINLTSGAATVLADFAIKTRGMTVGLGF